MKIKIERTIEVVQEYELDLDEYNVLTTDILDVANFINELKEDFRSPEIELNKGSFSTDLVAEDVIFKNINIEQIKE